MHDTASPLAPAAFNSVAERERLAHVRRGTFSACDLALDQITPLGDVEIAERTHDGCAVLLRIEPRMVMLVSVSRGQGQLAVAGEERDAVDRVADAMLATLRDDAAEHNGVRDTTLQLSAQAAYSSLLDDRFVQLTVEDGLWHLRGGEWPTEANQPPAGEEMLASVRYAWSGAHEALMRIEGTLVHLILRSGIATIRVAAPSPALLPAAEKRLRALIPESEQETPDEVTVAFWALGPNGPEKVARKLAVSPWLDIRSNYSRLTTGSLEPLLDEFRPGAAGRLLLWHGPPGTGKTHALRALASGWRDWCNVHYITDPDALFAQPSYMMRLLTMRDRPRPGQDEKWRLLVLEDTGELLYTDGKQGTGQGLSRLLNLVDGLIGQGLKVLVLITTNEPVGSLSQAVSRPGRCAALVEFTSMEIAEAERWLLTSGSSARVSGATTLAELYAILAGQDPPRRRQIGFAPQAA